tara:strand:- start:13976 stop:14107 length:132 start_codon:yes stop_codon:yes gene_type:complete
MNKAIWNKIKYWKDKYRNTPNGWAVSLMIGREYEENSRRKKDE